MPEAVQSNAVQSDAVQSNAVQSNALQTDPAPADALPTGDSTQAPTYTAPIQDDESMPTLTDEIKEFIVKGLAVFDTPSEVADSVKSEFGVECSAPLESGVFDT